MTGLERQIETTRLRFPRRLRLRRRPEFQRVMQNGRRVGDQRILLFGLPNEQPFNRLGLAVGRRHGSAVRRNRIKRLLREAFRLVQHDLPAGFDLVCVPRVAARQTVEDLQESFRTLIGRLARRRGGR